MKLILLLAFTAYFLPPSDGNPNPYEAMTAEDRGCPSSNDIPEIRRNAECNSDDEVLSENAKDVFACRKLCEEKPDCYFYIFGKGVNYGWCYWEDPELPKTDDQNVRNMYDKICKKEGWQDDQYDFYQRGSHPVGNQLPNGNFIINGFPSEVLVTYWQRNWRDHGFLTFE